MNRIIYTPKASKSERNMGCESKEEGNKRPIGEAFGNGNAITDQSKYKGNNHPTVKPLKLMEYLCILTKTPTGGIVLDPFAGSGTTLIACKKLGRPFVGIEKEEEYIKIAEARLRATQEPLL